MTTMTTMMECNRAAELIPWLLNGTLERAEEERLRDHLSSCSLCRREVEETAFVWDVFSDHPTSATLVAHAFEDPLAASERTRVQEHLELCRTCSAEVELIRQSQKRLHDGAHVSRTHDAPVRPFPAPADPTSSRRLPWRYATLAASLAGLLGLGGWWWTWQAGSEIRRSLAALEDQNQALRQAQEQAERRLAEELQLTASLQEQLSERGDVQLNTAVLDVFPDLTVRGSSGEVNEIEISPGSDEVVLMLATEIEPPQEATRVEIVDARGEVLDEVPGLLRHPVTDDYTVKFRVESLSRPGFEIRLYGPQEGAPPLETYRMRIK